MAAQTIEPKHFANMHPIIRLNEANFETEVLKSRQPVLVEFATGWSLPSMMLDGAMGEIASEFVDSLKVARVELDRNPNLGLWYGVRCLPTVLYFNDGEVRAGIFGTANKEAILSQLRPIMRNATSAPHPSAEDSPRTCI